MIEHINSKKVCIVEEHHHVLEYWIDYNLRSSTIPYLITLDHHEDTKKAFKNYVWLSCDDKHCISHEEFEKRRKEYLDKIQINDDIFLQQLKHDEHIDFAIRKNIITNAFVISYLNETSLTDCDNTNIYYIKRSSCYPGCNKIPHDDECIRTMYDKCIEDEFLQDALNNIPMQYKDNYILDIDLDYFHTIRSLEPERMDIFYDLIKNAKIITIAKECEWVNRTKLDDEIDSEYILDKLLEHIEIATNQ